MSSYSVKTLSLQLRPFVRSDAVGAILAELLGRPDREFSLSELGRRTGMSGAVIHREVGRLIESDVLRDRYEGRKRLDLPVNVTRLGRHQWEAEKREPFVSTIRSRPIVNVLTGDVHA